MNQEPSFIIRKSISKDIIKIMAVFDSARQYMRLNNNASQWSDEYPGENDILKDIEQGNSYVGIDSEGEIFMTFAFIKGIDQTYLKIYDGQWLNEKPYGTIHRIASNGKIPEVLKKACDYCFKQTANIRVDTHEDNSPMLKALNKLGFQKCGVIICRDGTPRIAFQKEKF